MAQILNKEIIDPTGQKLYVSGATPQDVNAAITSASLTPAQPISVPPPPTPSTINTDGTSAIIKANEAHLTTTDSPTTVPDWLKTLMSDYTPSKTAVSDAYMNTYGISPGTAQNERATAMSNLNTQNAAVQAAQEKYNALNAQIQGLDYQEQANAEGRGITAAGLAPITAARKASLQYQALLAQADLASAQGKATLASGVLKQANDHLDSLFEARKADIANTVSHQNSNFERIATYLTAKEQNKVAEMKAQTAHNQTQANNFINDVQSAVKDAAASGNSELAGSIAKLATISLDPVSKTFATDYAKANADLVSYKAQIAPKLKKGATNTLTPPDWFRTQYEASIHANVTPEKLQTAWDAYRQQNKQTAKKTAKTTYTTTQQNTLIGAGIPSAKIADIQQYINQYGLQATLDNSDMTEEQKTAIRAIYGQ